MSVYVAKAILAVVVGAVVAAVVAGVALIWFFSDVD